MNKLHFSVNNHVIYTSKNIIPEIYFYPDQLSFIIIFGYINGIIAAGIGGPQPPLKLLRLEKLSSAYSLSPPNPYSPSSSPS